MRRRDRRYWYNLIRAGVIELAAVLLCLFYIVLPIAYAGYTIHPRRAPVCCVTPADAGLAYEDVSFETSDGLTLRGWYIASRGGAAVMIAHGLGGNRIGIGQLDQAAALARRGLGVLLFDLRAHGESEGEAISYAGTDALAALAYLRNRDDVDPRRIGAAGLSLGAIVITQAAAQDDDIKALVLDGLGHAGFADFPPPGSVQDLAIVPYRWMTFKSLEASGVLSAAMIDVVDDIAPRPILFISGAGQSLERDTLRRYFAAAGAPKMLWEIPEAGHAGTWLARPREFEARIVAFFEQALLEK
ncbi:MAG TPA: alpha/beta hydrolase [Anaerolineae bacterium]